MNEQLLIQAIQLLNQIIDGGKINDEIPSQNPLNMFSKLRVSNGLLSETVTIKNIIDASILESQRYIDRFSVVNGFTVASNNVTILADWIWYISGLELTNTSTVLNFPLCATGYNRIDKIVATNINTFIRVQGVEVLGTPFAPITPPNTLEATFVTVTDTNITVENPPTPITNALFINFFNSRVQLETTVTNPLINNYAFVIIGVDAELAHYNGTLWNYYPLGGSGIGGSQNLHQVTNNGSVTDNTITAREFIIDAFASTISSSGDGDVEDGFLIDSGDPEFPNFSVSVKHPDQGGDTVINLTSRNKSSGEFDVFKISSAGVIYYQPFGQSLKTISFRDLSGDIALVSDIVEATDIISEQFDTKVDKVVDFGLSQENFSTIDKAKLDSLSNYTGFRGAQSSLSNIITAYPTGVLGDWAIITNPSGSAFFAIWDTDISAWVEAGQSPTIPGTNLAYTVVGNVLTITSDTGNDVVIPLATSSTSGLLSLEDKSKLDSITAIFTTTLKNLYDTASNWIITNGANVLNHLSNFSNPHNTTPTQIGAYSISEVNNLLANSVKTLRKSTGSEVAYTTQSTTEVILKTLTFTSNEIASGDWLKILLNFSKIGTAGTSTVGVRIGTNNSLSDAQVGTYTPSATSLEYGFKRERLQLKDGNILRTGNAATSSISDVLNYTVKTNLTLNPTTTWYLHITGRVVSALDTLSLDSYIISKS